MEEGILFMVGILLGTLAFIAFLGLMQYIYSKFEKPVDWSKFKGIDCPEINSNIEEIYRKKTQC